MSLPIHVDAYAGYRADERPRRFELDGVEYRIYAWERQWRKPDGQYFQVRASGKRYVLRLRRTVGRVDAAKRARWSGAIRQTECGGCNRRT